VDPRPGLLSVQLSVTSATSSSAGIAHQLSARKDSPLLDNTLSISVETESADCDGRAEDDQPRGASDGQVTLVSDLLVSSHRRHVPVWSVPAYATRCAEENAIQGG
jgi:hypothetical protein